MAVRGPQAQPLVHIIHSDRAFLWAGVHNAGFWSCTAAAMQPVAALKMKVRFLAEEEYEEEMRFRRRKWPRWRSALLQVCCGWGFAFAESLC